MWFDEADTWRSAIGQTNEGIAYSKFLTWKVHFETPPLAFLIARLGADLFDPDKPADGAARVWRPRPWTLRMGALACGVALIPVVFLLGWVIHGPALGLLAAGVVAVDPNMVDQSHQCRMYGPLALLMVIGLIQAIVLLRRPDRGWWQWGGMGLTLGLLLWTLQFGLVVWGGIALAGGVLLVGGWITQQPHPQSKRLIQGLVVAYGFGMAVACVGVYGLVDRILHGKEDSPDMAITQIGREIATYAKDLLRVPPFRVAGYDLTLLGLLVYPIAGLGLWLLMKRCKTSTAVLVCVGIANLMILIPFRRMHHFMDQRYLTGIQPALWIGLAMLPVAVQSKPWRAVATAFLGVYLGMQWWQSTHLDDWWQQRDRYLLTPMIVEVRDSKKDDEAIVYHPEVIEVLGDYCGLPPTPQLEDALYGDGIHLRDDAAVPDSVQSPTWLVLGMMNYPGRLPTANRTIDLLAAHYGVVVDEALRARHVQENRVVAVRFSRLGVEFRSEGIRG